MDWLWGKQVLALPFSGQWLLRYKQGKLQSTTSWKTSQWKLMDEREENPEQQEDSRQMALTRAFRKCQLTDSRPWKTCKPRSVHVVEVTGSQQLSFRDGWGHIESKETISKLKKMLSGTMIQPGWWNWYWKKKSTYLEDWLDGGWWRIRDDAWFSGVFPSILTFNETGDYGLSWEEWMLVTSDGDL